MPLVELNTATELLKSGTPVALPTETVYGLAAPIDNLDAIKAIFTIKKRPLNDPLIVHISSLEMAQKLCDHVNEDFKLLAESFWPGPISLVVKKNKNLVDDLITSGFDTVALRMPDSPLFLAAISKINTPLAAPSANPFKRLSPSKASHVLESLPEVAVVDGGDCNIGIESTIFDVENLSILRPGMISPSQISKVLGGEPVHLNFDAPGPGSEEDHYQPETPVVVYKKEKSLIKFLESRSHTRLEFSEDSKKTAFTLYKSLRELDGHADFISIRWSEKYETESWIGIKNRIEKASTYWMD